MECREFGKTGLKPSMLGFGMMGIAMPGRGFALDNEYSYSYG